MRKELIISMFVALAIFPVLPLLAYYWLYHQQQAIFSNEQLKRLFVLSGGFTLVLLLSLLPWVPEIVQWVAWPIYCLALFMQYRSWQLAKQA